ncbi:MAG: hypothetical protein IJI92_04540 [Erysipelotrichaceae bacterium]|nr:hypothetical protein [Erysipelotrichaceae bacterium]
MIDIEKLREYGADIDHARISFEGDDAFYLHLIELFIKKNDYKVLCKMVRKNDYRKAYETILNMKGVSGNLSLDPLFRLCSEVTEHLYNADELDYEPYLKQIKKQLDLLADLNK